MSTTRGRDPLPQPLREQLERLPREPGCYRFRDARGAVLYVGKARSLRARVRSYFQPGAKHPPKVAAMVAEARSVDVIVTASELDALILENNLIKEHKPRYNVLLRDDKNFPYLKLTVSDQFPRVVLVRRPRADGERYYGPFLPASHAWRTLRMIPRFFQVANCHVRFDGKQRPCLYFHLDQCLAPCAGKADPAEYAERVAQVRLFLEGRDRELQARLRERMEAASRELRFEAAARYRDMLASLERLAQRQQMASVGLEAIDFWAEHREGGSAAVELFRMREGRVIGRREFTFAEAPPPERLYDEILPQFYGSEEPPPEIVLPRLPQRPELIRAYLEHRRGGRVALKAPSRGERRRMLDLVARNARLAFEARFRARHAFGVQVLEALRELLDLPEVPYRIEGVDISHLAGQETRASLVVFEGGRPKKSDYRSYAIRRAAPGDDYAAIAEVVGRRYGRLMREGRRLPDLLLIDGGRGQLAAAREALSALGLADLPAASLAKREETIFVDTGGDPLVLARDDPVLHLFQQIRDEAHRFAVRQHRRARSKRTLESPLLRIRGVGPLTARRLLAQFGSIEGLRRANLEALARAVGPKRAQAIKEALERDPAFPGAADPAQ